jgi:hypothetical protein
VCEVRQNAEGLVVLRDALCFSHSGSNDINIYKINLVDGSLTPVGAGTVPTGGVGPVGVAVTGTLQ